MRRARKIVLWTIGVALALGVAVVGGAAAYFLYAPDDAIRGRLVSALEGATGKSVAFEGPIERAVWPRLAIRVGATRVTDPEGVELPDVVFTLSAQSVAVEAEFWPLLSGRLEIPRVELGAPILGVARAAPAPSTAAAEPATDTASGGPSTVEALASFAQGGRVHISEIVGVDAVARYQDAATGRLVLFEDVALSYRSMRGSDRVEVSAAGRIGAAPAELSLEIGALGELALGRAGSLVGRFEGAGAVASFDGRAALGGAEPLSAAGAGEIRLDETGAAADWVRAVLPPELAGLGAVDASGRADVSSDRLDIELSGEAVFNGELSVARIAATAGAGWIRGAGETALDVALENALLDAGYVGRIGFTPEGGLLVEGDYRLQAADVDALARWAGEGPAAALVAQAPLLESLNVSGSIALLADRAEAATTGVVGYNGRIARLTASLSGGADWRAGGRTASRIVAGAEGLFDLRWTGEFALFETRPSAAAPFLTLDGDLSARTPDVGRLRAWLGLPPTAAEVGDAGFDGRIMASAPRPPVRAEDLAPDSVLEEALSAPSAPTSSGGGALSGASIALVDAQIRVDGKATEISGAVALDGARLIASGRLSGGPLDLTPFTTAAAEFGVFDPVATGDIATAGIEPIALDADNLPATGWSTEPIDFAMLRGLELSARFELDGLRAGPFEIGAAEGEIASSGGRLTIDAPRAEAFGGVLRIMAAIDASAGGAPRLELEGALDGGDLRQLLTAIGQPAVLLGAISAEVDLAARGASEAEIARSLSGSARFDAARGVLFLIDFKTVSGGGGAEFLGARQVARGVTPYDAISGSFALEGGVARNRDLTLEGSVISFEGGGLIDVGGRAVDYVITPTRFGEVAIIDRILGRAFPIVIRGSWDAIKIGADAEADVRRLTGE